jgi:4,5-DOPA dioxygenase extradiol
MTRPLPPLFISHGSPMTALEPGAAGAFWSGLGPAIDAGFGRPRAVLALSAHSLSREPLLLGAARHEAVHDFGGFPQALFDLRYAPPGAPDLARQVAALLQAGGHPVHLSPQGGLDHGIWTPLRAMYPAADVPVLPLAWPPHWTAERLMGLGALLAPLAQQGVLIMGSGSITHNLRLFMGSRGAIDQPEQPECAQFRHWMAQQLARGDVRALADYRRCAPHAAHMHPTDEHLLPWFLAAGAGGLPLTGARLHQSVTWGHMAMDAYAFGPAALGLAATLDSVAA